MQTGSFKMTRAIEQKPKAKTVDRGNGGRKLVFFNLN